MSYQVLARKWRPHQFGDVVGQAHVLTALSNALDHDRLHHAYLFSGTRGVGKTTIARIFAKGLNCEQGITSTPCGVCSTCKEIDEGRFVDLLEIDAASRTKVEDTRELLDNVQYKPARGRFKVYLIDEVHMLSRHSFNALLKTLEEPPEYVKFVLATTDPQKLPVTILSRCLQFHLKHLDAGQIQAQLEHVLSHESVPSESRALSLIARAAEGSMRDALSLADQAIALGNGSVNAHQVTEMLGTLSTDQALLLLEALSHADADTVMQCITHLAEVGVEWDGLLKELSAQLHKVAMGQALPNSIDATSPDANRLSLLAKTFSPQDVQLFYQVALQGRQDLPYAPDGRAGLEMVLLRMLAFRPVSGARFEPKSITVPASDPAVAQVKTPSQAGQAQLAALKAQVAKPSRTAPVPPVSSQPVSPQPAAQQQERFAPQANTAQPSTVTKVEPAVPEEPVQAATSSVGMGQGMREERSPSPVSEPPVADPQMSSHMAAMAQQEQREYESGEDDMPEIGQPVSTPDPVSSASKQESSAASSLVAARNMLRSRTRSKEGQGPKKGKPVSARGAAPSVLDRIAAKHSASAPATFDTATDASSSITGHTAKAEENAPYRWKPTQEVVLTEKPVITPAVIKRALAHERTPEMREKLLVEAARKDHWSKISDGLDVSRLVKQMALNSAMTEQGDTITLWLRPAQAHLNTEKAQQQLATALSAQLERTITVVVEIGEQGLSPLEWRDKLYTDKLTQAGQSLQDDPNVRFICQRFSAALDEESIRPI